MKIDGRKIDHATLEGLRFAAVRAVEEGHAPSAVARALDVDARRVYEWLALHRAGGWDALRARKATGRPPKLGTRQIRWIADTVARRNPARVQLPGVLWTREQVKALIQRRFGLTLSVKSVWRLLEQLGVTCRAPLSRAPEERPQVSRWLREEYPKIVAAARREKAEIFFQAESDLRPSSARGATQGRPAGRPAAGRGGRSPRDHVISATTPKGTMHFMIVREGISAETFVGFLKGLMHRRRRPVFLILDGIASRRAARMIRQYADSLEGRLRLFFVPAAGSPSRERVVSRVKGHGTRGRTADSGVAL